MGIIVLQFLHHLKVFNSAARLSHTNLTIHPKRYYYSVMIIEEVPTLEPAEIFELIKDLEKPFILSGEGRYTYLGAMPYMTLITVKDGPSVKTTLRYGNGEETTYEDPFRALKDTIKGKVVNGDKQGDEQGGEKSPFPFTSGAVGFLSYDLKCLVEGRLKGAKIDPHIPLALFNFYDPIIVHDGEENKTYIAGRGGTGRGRLEEEERRSERMEEFRSILYEADAIGIRAEGHGIGAERFGALRGYTGRGPATDPTQIIPAGEALGGGSTALQSTDEESSHLRTDRTREEYIKGVLKAKDYIKEGDIYQINLSQTLTLETKLEPSDIFKTIWETFPAPFSYYLDTGEVKVIMNSPERLLKVTGGVIETSPIKGTRPRGESPSEDREKIKSLKESTKERAEHVMIVDLERSDMGKVSERGSVRVERFEDVSTLPNLHHMVSVISSTLKSDLSPIEALKALFPGGSITGAPKVRAMEVIEEIEGRPRGLYTGAVGWIDSSGDMDMAMAIRTATYHKETLRLDVGGGIVADSVPEDEYDETILKASDFILALNKGRTTPLEIREPGGKGAQVRSNSRAGSNRDLGPLRQVKGE